MSVAADLIEGWVNPFAEKQDFINISTAKTAPRDISSDPVKAHEVGEQCYAIFKDRRLEMTLQQRNLMTQLSLTN